MISLHASGSFAICAKHVPVQKPVLVICILVTEMNLIFCTCNVVHTFVSTVKSHIPNTWKRVRRSQGGAGMFSVQEPAWLLLLLMPEINLGICTATMSKQKGNGNSKWTSHLTSNSQTRIHG